MNSTLDMMWSNWRRLGGAAGIAFIVLFIIGAAIGGDAPNYDKPGSEIRAWFVDNGDQWLTGCYITGLAVVLLFLPFLTALRSYLGLAEGGRMGWSRLAFAGGIVFVLWTGAGTMFLTGPALAAKDMSDDTVKALAAIDFYAFTTASLIMAPFLLASGLVILRTGVPWRILGALAVVLGVLAAIAGAAPIDGDPDGFLASLGFVPFIGVMVYILALSIGMILKAPAGEAAATTSAPPAGARLEPA